MDYSHLVYSTKEKKRSLLDLFSFSTKGIIETVLPHDR